MNEVLVKIYAEKRLKTGTGNSREFRTNKLIPGIIYGEKKEPIPISLNEKEQLIYFKNYLFWTKLPFGVGKKIMEGDIVTVISWGAMVQKSIEAINMLEIDNGIIDRKI